MDVVELCPALNTETPPAARSALPRCGDFKVRFQGLMWWGPGDWGNAIKGGLLGLAKKWRIYGDFLQVMATFTGKMMGKMLELGVSRFSLVTLSSIHQTIN